MTSPVWCDSPPMSRSGWYHESLIVLLPRFSSCPGKKTDQQGNMPIWYPTSTSEYTIWWFWISTGLNFTLSWSHPSMHQDAWSHPRSFFFSAQGSNPSPSQPGWVFTRWTLLPHFNLAVSKQLNEPVFPSGTLWSPQMCGFTALGYSMICMETPKYQLRIMRIIMVQPLVKTVPGFQRHHGILISAGVKEPWAPCFLPGDVGEEPPNLSSS